MERTRRWFNSNLKPLFRECLGVYIMILLGVGSMAQTIISRNTKGEFLSTSFAFAFATPFAIPFAMYITQGVSGKDSSLIRGQLNPAVSLSMCVLGGHQWQKLPLYTVFQLLGSFLGAATIYVLYYDAIMYYGEGKLTVTGPTATARTFATYPSDYLSIWNGFVDHIIGTATLLVCLLALADKRNSGLPALLEPLMSGLVVFIIGLSMGGNCGYPLHPARDLGPRLFTYLAGWGGEVLSAGGAWFWVPLVAPFLGGLVGVALYQLFIEVHHPDLQLKPKGLCLGNKMAALETVELSISHLIHSPKETQLDTEKTGQREEKINYV